MSQREIARHTGIPKSTIQYNVNKHHKASTQLRKVLVLPDIHVPYHDQRSINAVLQYAEANAPWSAVILLGDLMDFDFISRFSEKQLRLVTGRDFKRDYEKANVLLDKIGTATRPDNFYYLQGNHEQRVTRYLNARPHLEGYIEPEIALRLDDRGIEWFPFWDTGAHVTIGEAHFTHGRYCNEHHAKKNVTKYGTNVFYGHTHDVQEYAWERLGDNATIVASSLGCLCKYQEVPQHSPGAPNKWQQAFGVFHFQESGYFNHFVTRIFHHRFVGTDGVLYEG
jgi:predicted phosphodiesterase